MIDCGMDYVSDLASIANREWPNIRNGNVLAEQLRTRLCDALEDLVSDDYDFVVFGSLARGEWTVGSDVDWTLLIDSQVSADHRKVAGGIESRLRGLEFQGRPLIAPGTEGVFGNMAFSHDIVHLVGGQRDSNRNTTQRILLLLEAASISESCAIDRSGPFDRVVREILQRYLLDDSLCHKPAGERRRVPRFLLNDIVRFWRTMCVDFAYKEWEQNGRKWALRNYKLRLSRKLLFVSGLLTIFNCSRLPELAGLKNGEVVAAIQECLLQFVRSTPLQILVFSLLALEQRPLCVQLLDIYDRFLGHLNNAALRSHLADLSPASIYADPQFSECRELSHQFQQCLNSLCFHSQTEFTDFIVNYGVF